MDEETEVQNPTKFAIIGIIFNISFYPAMVFLGKLGEAEAVPPSLLLLAIPFSFPLIGSFFMQKATDAAKNNNSKTGSYYFLMVISVIHTVILLMILATLLLFATGDYNLNE